MAEYDTIVDIKLNTDIKYLPQLNKEIINKLISNLPYNTFNTIIGTDDIIINENKPYTL
jgi:hypothetical protein